VDYVDRQHCVPLCFADGWLISPTSTVRSPLAVATSAPLYTTMLAGANCAKTNRFWPSVWGWICSYMSFHDLGTT
jgi:hypothetical protein